MTPAEIQKRDMIRALLSGQPAPALDGMQIPFQPGKFGADRSFEPGPGVKVAQAGGDYLTGSDVGGIPKAVDSAGVANDAQKAKFALMSVMEALDDYERQYREGGGGAVIDQAQRDLLNQRRGAVQMIAKDIFAMGAPQAGDIAMLNKVLGVDPVGIMPNALDAIDDLTGGVIGSDLDRRFYAGVEATRDLMTDIAAPKLREYGLSAEEIAKIRRKPYSADMSDADFDEWLRAQ